MQGILIGAASVLALVAAAIGAGGLLERRAEAQDAVRFPPPGQMVDVGGRRLHLLCRGEGPGPTVVLEAGGGNSAALAHLLQERVAAFARVCAYDRAGLGWSDPVPPGRTFEDRAADLDALLTRANVPGPYVLVGESLGGLVVRTYARAHPDRVAGMVLVDAAEEASVFPAFTPQVLAAMANGARRNETLARLGLLRLAASAKAAALLPGYPEAVRAGLVSRMVRPAYWRATADEASGYTLTAAERRGAGGFGRLGGMPLTVIRHGKPFTGELASLEPGWAAGQARLAALSTRGKVVVAEGAGHGIAQEQPGLVAEAIREVWQAARGPDPAG